MALFTKEQRAFAEAISNLAYTNPFLPERIEGEHRALQEDFQELDLVWHSTPEGQRDNPNLESLGLRAEDAVSTAREKLGKTSSLPAEELELYRDLVLYVLYHRYRDHLHQLVSSAATQKVAFYGEFARDVEHLLHPPNVHLGDDLDPPHLMAISFQIRRAFVHIFTHLAGTSLAMARLRAQAWQSIFTHDLTRYRRTLFDRMGDISTLVTGPSGTGKELVARAIGLSRYIPFDPDRQAFTEDFAGSFFPLNLSALSPTLIESELFGHRRGSFTGALDDRVGWLEVCPSLGTVFLDEIGELDGAIQVKLLRVLQTRTFQRLGDTVTREFKGKVITATNRDLSQEMREGAFRQDLYYRLCSDIIITPSLYEQLRERPDELRHLVDYIVQRMLGEEPSSLTDEVVEWVSSQLGESYTWPGNFRELEQCVRNVLIRKEYHPSCGGPSGPRAQLGQDFVAGILTADEMLRKYCTLVYSQTGNYEETARRLGIDRRTVKSKVDESLLAVLRPE